MEESTFEEVGQHFCSVLCLNHVVFMWGKWAVTKSAFNADHDLTQISQNLLRLGNWRRFTWSVSSVFASHLCHPATPSSTMILMTPWTLAMTLMVMLTQIMMRWKQCDPTHCECPGLLGPNPDLFFVFSVFPFFPFLPRRSFSSLSVWPLQGSSCIDWEGRTLTIKAAYFDHISLHLASLHWLPVGLQMQHKLCAKMPKLNCSGLPDWNP